jgi:hypothetical protein
MNTPAGADGAHPMAPQHNTSADLVDLHIKTEYNPNGLGKNAPGMSPRPLSALESAVGTVVLFQDASARRRDSMRLQRHLKQARGRAIWR